MKKCKSTNSSETGQKSGTASRKKDKGTIKLLTANVKRVVLPGGEKRECLILEPDILAGTVKDDYLAGATPFGCIADPREDILDSKVEVIRTTKIEEGFKACLYRKAYINASRGIDPEDYISYEDMDLEHWDPKDEMPENILPVVTIGELKLHHEPDPFGGAGFGNTVGGMVGNQANKKPYWEDYCGDIILSCSGDIRYGFYGTDDNLLCDAVACLGKCSHIFVVYLESRNVFMPFSDEDDLDGYVEATSPHLLQVIVRNNSDVYDIDMQNVEEYYKKLLYALCKRHKLGIPDDFPVSDMIKKLCNVKEDMRAEFLDQLIVYTAERSKEKILSRKILRLLGRVDGNNSKSARLKGYELLDSLDGMANVKDQVKSFIDSMEIAVRRKSFGLKSAVPVALLYVGPPGTGKTTVAQAMADVIREKGLLPSKGFVSLSAADLMGQYVGWTVEKVKNLFAENSILFIDEAYSLTEGRDLSPFAHEALAQLCIELENAQERSSHLVIFAGYGGSTSVESQNKMKAFLNSNPGIASRIAATIEFEPYSPEDMISIFFKICKNDGYDVFDGAKKDEIARVLKPFFAERMKDKSYGNAREARNLLGEVEKYCAGRLLSDRTAAEVSEDELKTLEVMDVYQAVRNMQSESEARNGRSNKKMSVL
ncbi:MAG: AAA family ATPase [Lachnospiraceae bacterium]|nr:AAA family ATPase [Lachnospiraceae bacterium]